MAKPETVMSHAWVNNKHEIDFKQKSTLTNYKTEKAENRLEYANK